MGRNPESWLVPGHQIQGIKLGQRADMMHVWFSFLALWCRATFMAKTHPAVFAKATLRSYANATWDNHTQGILAL